MWPDRKSEDLREHCRLNSKYGDGFDGLPSKKEKATTSKAHQMFDNMKGWVTGMERRKTMLQGFEDDHERLRLEQANVPVDAPRHGELTADMLLLGQKISKQRATNHTWRYDATRRPV